MTVYDILQAVLWRLAETVDQWRSGAIGLLLVVIAACLATVAWVVTGGPE